jgi:hypothetical protein
MASTPIPPVTPHPAALPPMPAVARILSQFEPQQLASFVEVAIGLLDLAEGDPEAEDNADEEPAGDEQDASWTEFTSRGRHKHTAGGTEPFDKHEDTEEDDNDTTAEDGPPRNDGAPGDREDAEPEHDQEACAEPHHPTPIYGVDQTGRMMHEGEAGDSYAMTGGPFAENDR